MSVRTSPGLIENTGIPYGASSLASCSPKRWSAALLAPYAVSPIPPPGRYAAPLATLTIRPAPRSIIPGMAARAQRNAPRTFTSKTRHQSSGATSHVGMRRPLMPALFTSSSTAPTAANARSTDSGDPTSSSTARPPISPATASTCASVRAATTTDQPSSASARATFAPIPRPPPVTRATRSNDVRSAKRRRDRIEGLGVLDRREVARVEAERGRPHRAPHDLRRARPRKCIHEHDPARSERLAERPRHDRGDLSRQLARGLEAGREAAEDPGGLALHLVRHAHRRRLANGRVPRRGRLELGRADALAGDVERVVGAPVQEPVAVAVGGGPVAVHPHAGDPAPVGLEVALGVAPEAARHPGERLPADELADLAAHGATFGVDDVHRHPECRAAERARLDRRRRSGREEAGPDLGAAGAVDDRAASAADVLVEPAVGLRVPGLAGGDEDLKRGEVVALDELGAVGDQRAHQCR